MADSWMFLTFSLLTFKTFLGKTGRLGGLPSCGFTFNLLVA